MGHGETNSPRAYVVRSTSVSGPSGGGADGLLCAIPQLAESIRAAKRFRVVPCMDGARGAREKNLTFRETIRVQPCIRPLDAAVLAAGPDVIR
jgi:hypothetical protein